MTLFYSLAFTSEKIKISKKGLSPAIKQRRTGAIYWSGS